MSKLGFAAKAAIAVIVILVVVVAGFVVYEKQRPKTVAMCALFDDSIGLYNGNDVTLLGVKIGKVTNVNPEGDKVRIDFTVPESQNFPANVTAVTLNASIVTDRSVELTAGYTDGAKLDRSQCITKTQTPVGVSKTFDAANKLSAQVLGDSTDPQSNTEIKELLSKLNVATQGTGTDFNKILQGVAQVAGNPDARDAQLRLLIDNVDQLLTTTTQKWPDVQLFLDNGKSFAEVLTAFALELSPAIDSATAIQPALIKLEEHVGPSLYKILDALVSVTDLASAHVDSAVDLLKRLPMFTQSIQQMYDADTKAGRLTIAPTLTASANTVAGVCTALNLRQPGTCTPNAADNSKVDVGLLSVILASGGIQ